MEAYTCNINDRKQNCQYVEDGGGVNAGRIKAKGTNLCMKAAKEQGGGFTLDVCKEADACHLLTGFSMDVPFELNTYGKEDHCLTMNHHARKGEDLYAALCEKARKSDTALWVAYYKSDRSKLTYADPECGSSYYLCRNCEGDCDSSDNCEGDLRCFQRNEWEPVPGCKGPGSKGALVVS